MEFIITSKGAININDIVFIQLAEVKESKEGYSDLRIDVMQTKNANKKWKNAEKCKNN